MPSCTPRIVITVFWIGSSPQNECLPFLFPSFVVLVVWFFFLQKQKLLSFDSGPSSSITE